MQNKYLKLAALLLGTAVIVVIIFLITQRTQLGQDAASTYKANVSYPTTPLTLTLWLPSEEKGNFDEVAAEYRKIHPSVTVDITYIEADAYQARLIAASSQGTLPDLFVFRNESLPIYLKSLQPAPTTVFTTDQYSQLFADFASKKLVSGNSIYGAPLGIATLGLVYNKDRFAQANVTNPPTNWTEFETTNDALRKKTGQSLFVSGVALGTSSIRNYPDIISMLMMQNGAAMTNQPPTQATFSQPDSTGYASAAKAVEFYASFAQPAKQNYSWSDSLGGSLEALASNKTAMTIDYSPAARVVQKQNAKINIGMAALPQTNPSSAVNYGNILTGGVAKTSKNTEIAWDFWGFSTSKEMQKKFSLLSFWPASRKDLTKEQLNDKDLAPFARQTSTAQDWYKGVSYATNADLREMINNYLAGFDSKIVVNNANTKVTTQIQKSQ